MPVGWRFCPSLASRTRWRRAIGHHRGKGLEIGSIRAAEGSIPLSRVSRDSSTHAPYDVDVDTENVSVLLGMLALVSLSIAIITPLIATRYGNTDSFSTAVAVLPAMIAATSMAGSLYYSGVANFEPCLLCWWQRIFMYPLAILMPIGLVLRRPVPAWQPLVMALFGGSISAYHYWIQVRPSDSTICDLDNPCSARWVETFGFISIPFMAFAGFAAIASLSAVNLWLDREPAES